MRRLYLIPVLLVMFSYLIFTPILLILGFDTSTFNLLMKGMIVLLALALMVFGLSHWRWPPPAILFLLVFFAIYAIRLVYDIFARGLILPLQSPLYINGYYFGLTVLPCVLIAIAMRPQDARAFHTLAFWCLVAVNIALLLFTLVMGITDAATAFQVRVEAEGVIEGSAVLNPLYISLAGAMIASVCIARLATWPRMSVPVQGFHLVLVVLGAANVLFGASRGPAVALILAVVAIIVRGIVVHSTQRGKLQPRSLVFLGAAIGGFAFLVASGAIEVNLVERFETMLSDRNGGQLEERDYIYAATIRDFLSAPFIGSAYVIKDSTFFPHNIYLESLMATGVIGSAFLFAATVVFLRRLANMLFRPDGSDTVPIALMALCLFIFALTSGSINSSPEIWVMMATVMMLGVANERSGATSGALPSARKHLPLPEAAAG